MDLNTAFANFFAGRAQYQKSKKKTHTQSMRLRMEQRHIVQKYTQGEKLIVPILGELDIVWSQIIKTYDIIIREDLNVQTMMKNKRIERVMGDVGINMLFQMLDYKAEWTGKKIIKADRYFPSSKRCSQCHTIHGKPTLSDRTMNCSCGCNLDRDHNAALNLLQEGLRLHQAWRV